MKKYLSLVLMLAAAAIWGFAFAMQKVAAELAPFTLCAIRSFLAVIFLLPAALCFDKFSGNGRRLISKKGVDFRKSELIGGLACGVTLFVASNLQQMGIGEGTDAGKASFITALYIVIVPLLFLLLKRFSPLNVWISVAIAVAGFYLLCVKDGFSIAPSDLLVLLCALTFAMQIISIDLSLSVKGTDCIRLSCIQFFVAGVLSLICALIFERGSDPTVAFKFIPQLLYLGILSSGVAYTLQIIGQKHTPPAIASIVLSLESVFGAIAGSVILGERMTAREYAGCGIIFLAVLLSQIDFKSFIKTPKGEK